MRRRPSLGYIANGYSPAYSPASSPFSYTGAQAAGAQVAATAGGLVSTVASPVIGFTQGVLQGRALLVIGLVAAVIVLNKNSA